MPGGSPAGAGKGALTRTQLGSEAPKPTPPAQARGRELDCPRSLRRGAAEPGTSHGTRPGSLFVPCSPVPVLGARALQPALPAARGLSGEEYEARGPVDAGHKAAGAYLETPAPEGGG